jgi:hypothetical protein
MCFDSFVTLYRRHTDAIYASLCTGHNIIDYKIGNPLGEARFFPSLVTMNIFCRLKSTMLSTNKGLISVRNVLLPAAHFLDYSSTLKTEAVNLSETSLNCYQTRKLCIPVLFAVTSKSNCYLTKRRLNISKGEKS